MEKLIVPVYLNQRLVFDLLAMLQGGISTVTAVTRTESSNSSSQEKAGAAFGLSQAFSTLLKIDISGETSRSKKSDEENRLSEERVHTPASLFYQLRNIMLERDLLKLLSKEVSPEPGDIVEFEASLKRNPIVETMDTLSEMMNMAILFEDKSAPQKGAKRNQGSDYQKIQKQMMGFSETLKTGDTIDLTADNLSTSHAAVITLETGYLNDPMMSDLVDGKFRVLGKVIRSLDSSDESISLIRKTALSKMPAPLLEQVFGQLATLGTEQGFGIPSLTLEIPGPAIQILPVAIYA
ncbi:MAG: hypothetical protein AB1766_03920 [Pseudomonadota bacterium]